MKAWTEGMALGFWEPRKICLTRRAALAHVRHRGMMFMGPAGDHFQSLSETNCSDTGLATKDVGYLVYWFHF